MKKSLFGMLLATSIILTACGSKASADRYSYSVPSSAKYEMATEEAIMDADVAFGASEYEINDNGTSVSTTENASTSNRKLIKTVDLTVETKEFDILVNNLSDQIAAIGGYVERMDGFYGSKYSSYRSEKSATIVARVPASKLDSFIASVGENSNITYRSENVSDVTLDYVDLESHKKMLQEEQGRLLEFLKEAETIEDIIAIEDRLTNVKYQLDSMESQIRTYDNKIDYSTVTININEVIDYTVTVEPEKNAFERMGDGFVNSLQSIGIGIKEFVVWFVISIPYFVLWAVIITIIVIVVKKIRGRNPEKVATRLAKKAAKKQLKAEAKLAKKNKATNKEIESVAINVDEENK